MTAGADPVRLVPIQHMDMVDPVMQAKRTWRMLSAGLAALMLTAGAAPAADMVRIPYDDTQPCAEAKVLKRIVSRFDHQVKNVPHLPDVAILDFRNISEVRYIPESEDRPIARRYCSAHVDLSDGRSKAVWYLIEGRMGYASIGEGVEFCVDGFDRWLVYNGYCRVLR